MTPSAHSPAGTPAALGLTETVRRFEVAAAAPGSAPGCAAAGAWAVGIVSSPDDGAPPSALGLVVVVGGPQYRVGSHRQFVGLARAAAAAGFPALRFDVRGMGDTAGPLHHFEGLDDDIAAAIAALRLARPEVERVVLWGLCDGASAALMYVQRRRDPRVAGLCLANPWVRSAATEARTQVKHYYTQRLRDPAFWRKLLRGEVARGAVGGLWSALKRSRAAKGSGKLDPASAAMDFRQRMAAGAMGFEAPLLWVISGQDLTAKEFLDVAGGDVGWQKALSRPVSRRLDLPEADHTFSTLAHAREVERATCDFLRQLATP